MSLRLARILCGGSEISAPSCKDLEPRQGSLPRLIENECPGSWGQAHLEHRRKQTLLEPGDETSGPALWRGREGGFSPQGFRSSVGASKITNLMVPNS